MGCGASRRLPPPTPDNPNPSARPADRCRPRGGVYEGFRRSPSPTLRGGVAAYTWTAPPDPPPRDRRNSTGGDGREARRPSRFNIYPDPADRLQPRRRNSTAGQLRSNANPFGNQDPSAVETQRGRTSSNVGSVGSAGSTGTSRRVNIYQESLHQLAGQERPSAARGQQQPGAPAVAVVHGGGGGGGQVGRSPSGGSQRSGGSAPMSASSSVQRNASRRSGQGPSGSRR